MKTGTNPLRATLRAGALLLACACLLPAMAAARELLVAGTSFTRVFERTPEGEFTGLGVELLRAMARVQGDTVRFELYPWMRAQDMVAAGRADVLVGPYKTVQREAQFSFMDLPFYQDNLLFYARAGSKLGWSGHYDSLKHRRIVTVLGWVYGPQFDNERSAMDITQVATVEKGLTMLLNGRMDLLAANERNAATGIASLGPHGEFVPLMPVIGREVGYFAFPKDAQHEALRLAFNASFKKLVDTGDYAAMARRLGVTVPTAVRDASKTRTPSHSTPATEAQQTMSTPSSHPAGPYDIHSTFLHLADGGRAQPLAVTPTFWQELGSGQMSEVGESGRMVTTSSFDSDWNSWEMHPEGEEFVCLLSGAADMLLERADGSVDTVRLTKPGDFVLVPPGAWHTAHVSTPTTMLFITPGAGTAHRPI